MKVHVDRLALSVAAVALVTGAVFGLKEVAPVLSLGVLYIFAVLPVAVFYGLGYALGVSIASMLAFNFFFLPPLHTLALTDSENWVALAVYLVTAVVVSELAAVARRRAQTAAEAEALRRALDLDEGDRAGLLETIRLEAARLERLVADLLDLSRLEAGAAPARRELWTVDELVSRALEAIGADAARISLDLPPRTAHVCVDAAQIERVLVNVLENALRLSSPADPVDITARNGKTDVLLRISDRGPGLAEHDREWIFQPFEHGPGSRRGTGLALAIARGFAEANGCRLWAEPTAGSGVAFVLTLPAPEPARVLA